MVHALRQVWGALRPGAALVDLRPISARWPVLVTAGGRTRRAGRVDDSAGIPDDRAADRAMREVVGRGWFRLERRAHFTFGYVWDSVEEMVEYVAAHWEGCAVFPERTLRAARLLAGKAGTGVQVRVVTHMIISRYAREGGARESLPWGRARSPIWRRRVEAGTSERGQ